MKVHGRQAVNESSEQVLASDVGRSTEVEVPHLLHVILIYARKTTIASVSASASATNVGRPRLKRVATQ